MARFVSWWDSTHATPEGVAVAAERAGILLESGDYAVGTLTLDDDEPPVKIEVNGAVVATTGGAWLVYPAPSRWGGWRAQPACRDGAGFRLDGLKTWFQVGTAEDSAEEVLDVLLSSRRRPGRTPSVAA